MRWEPIAAMLVLLGLATWLVLATGRDSTSGDAERSVQVRVGTVRGTVEVIRQPALPVQFRLRFPGIETPPMLPRETVERIFGPVIMESLLDQNHNWAFQLFNITSWASLLWILVGLLGQGAFLARMLVQWLVSEKRRESVVPEVFWWLSLGGAGALFSYFVWRRDIVGVLGQTTGVVVYVRNLRLISKRRKGSQQHKLETDGN